MAEVSTPPHGAPAPSSQDEQSGAAAQAQQTASQAKDAAQDKAQEVMGQAQEKAQEAKQQAGSKVREQVDQRSKQAGEQVSTTATDLRTVGETLREQGKETPAKLAEQAAERTEKLGSYLTESDADKILSDVENFARKQPWAVVAGGLALGFAASRFMKASSSQRYSQRGQSASSGSVGQLPSSTGTNGYSTGTTPDVYAPPVGAPVPPPVAPTVVNDVTTPGQV